MTSGAAFSPCGKYRWSLTRIWDETKPLVCVCGLNPSTADAENDDPTIRRCIGFARSWAMGGLVMLNAYAFRSTDPKALLKAGDPVGKANLATILEWAGRSDLLVAAWGANIAKVGRPWQDTLLWHLRHIGVQVHALKLTKNGFPAHPLYLPRSLTPRVWEDGILK